MLNPFSDTLNGTSHSWHCKCDIYYVLEVFKKITSNFLLMTID